MSKPTSIDQILIDLDSLLSEEHKALKRLAADEIEQLATRKVELVEALARLLPPGGARGDDASALKRIREKQLHNQLLLVHARDSVRGLISHVTGGSANNYSRHPSTVPPVREGARLHISG
jgi:hypothetical protein